VLGHVVGVGVPLGLADAGEAVAGGVGDGAVGDIRPRPCGHRSAGLTHTPESGFELLSHPTIQFQARDVASSATNGTVTFDASAHVSRADLGVDTMPSLIIGSMLDVTVSAVARRAE